MKLTLSAVTAVLVALLAAPLIAKAQDTKKAPRIGVLMPQSPGGRGTAALREGLRELGYVEGRNIAIEWRFAGGKAEQFPDLAADLVRGKVDVIVATINPAVAAAQRATSTIPIVMVMATGPVGSGFVASLARPAGNITGLTTQATDLHGKWLQLLKEAVPNASRMAVLWDPAEPGRRDEVREAEVAAPALAVQLQLFEARTPSELDRAFSAMTSDGAGAVFVWPSSMIYAHRARIAELAAKSRLPTMCVARWYVEVGCLMSYAPDLVHLYRRSAYFVDRILKGVKPGDLPVEQPTKFELVINIKAAKALELTIPQSLLLRADELIQ
jgi:putative ABC transport system substrate-binding protein